MLVRKPSETVTGESPEVPVLPLELAVLDDEEHPAASRAMPNIAAAMTRRI
jgi:hypothetical protein